MRILVSNDDGYFAPGIAALVEAVRPLGEVFVVAPERDRSGASNSLTLDRPLSVRTAASGFLYVDGTPTDCVHVAITGLFDFKFDLVVSGINDGANMGDDTIYSGTVAAAMEGFQLGVPAIAFSLIQKGHAHLDTAARIAGELVALLAPRLIGQPMLLNVNIPALPRAEIRGFQATRLGKRHFAEKMIKAQTPRGDTVYWIGPAGSAKDGGPGTDFHAVADNRVSVTPLDSDLTAGYGIDPVKSWLAD